METSRKRGREDDDEEEAAADNSEFLQPKKQDLSISFPDEIDDSLYKYEFHDGIGVFDFPWLKEGVIFSSETAASFEDHEEDKFAPTSYLQDSSSVAAAADHVDINNKSSSSSSSSSVQNKNQNQDQNQNQNKNDKNACEGKKKKEDEEDDSFWSLVVDDLEPLDCIWSSVIDQPLDVGFHKG